jgi:HPt (histidine-containing phosphotransfer) domain-containing protein
LHRGDDLLLLQMLHAVCARVDQLLTQGIALDESEEVDRTQNKIDRLKQELEKLRVYLRRAKEADRRRRQLNRNHGS